ncbi:MAG TPA: DUF4097 family beta strand repeat-containing protein [Thermoanaerobaculia bacterium]|nr:DUF4097 family beta strand repeat-containing protein [Thermoanaerobaculia bacterium]
MKRVTLCTLLAAVALAAGADRIDKSVPAAAGQRLEIDLRTGGAITVRGTGESAVSVTVDRQGRDAADCEVRLEATGSGARLSTRYAGHRLSYSSDLRIEIRVPRRFDVELRSMGGGVLLDGIEGRFRGATNGGELRLHGLAGDVDLKTLGGDIRVASSRLNGSVSTNGGVVELDDVEGSLQGHSLGGKVTYHNARGGGNAARGDTSRDTSRGAVVMSSMGGDLEVQDAPQGAELTTMGGNVHVHSAARYVKASTMGGDVAIDRIDGRVDATTMAGDVTVSMAGDPARGDRGVRLSSNAGELRLTVPAELAMDIDIQLFYTRNSRRDYRVHSDFPLDLRESHEWDTSHGTPRKLIHATGRHGAGTHRVELRTINGDVYLTKAK